MALFRHWIERGGVEGVREFVIRRQRFSLSKPLPMAQLVVTHGSNEARAKNGGKDVATS